MFLGFFLLRVVTHFLWWPLFWLEGWPCFFGKKTLQKHRGHEGAGPLRLVFFLGLDEQVSVAFLPGYFPNAMDKTHHLTHWWIPGHIYIAGLKVEAVTWSFKGCFHQGYVALTLVPSWLVELMLCSFTWRTLRHTPLRSKPLDVTIDLLIALEGMNFMGVRLFFFGRKMILWMVEKSEIINLTHKIHLHL